ncbi:DNA polymerase-3 subunit gamma/tau [Micrococcales bacterium KH10]|nr:DNA polymerase-3 subunit gamma/tau [Micrococcales bacterium KH10]
MSQALYRRYRPESFDEVIGQEHVTGPLMQALKSGRVNHAYLFSGPRGCGKTTSARILARVLNCAANTEESPIAVPCGSCESCMELGRGGSGSLDVVEIDAASHGGVDDARDLRERATFSPSRDRFKIFILDEAHMVTSAGFNALLKIVEEPPPYLKFIFATTEPDKVIGTIRSRTHHYPFRLVPPEVLQPYLEQVCAAENIVTTPGVLPLVVRAGGGSVRDSLSVLDQLISGADGNEVSYEIAAGLLGFTPVTLLDDVVEAVSGQDGAGLFRVVEQVIATGHEPRRFVEDLLERFRDLLVLKVSGEGGAAVFSSYPADQVERMGQQAGSLGLAQLSRAADIINVALTEMTGATSPRLHLELLCARLLLPNAESELRSVLARVENLESGAVTSGRGSVSNVQNAPAGSAASQQTGRGLTAPQSTAVVAGPTPEGSAAQPVTETQPAQAVQPAQTAQSAPQAGQTTQHARTAPRQSPARNNVDAALAAATRIVREEERSAAPATAEQTAAAPQAGGVPEPESTPPSTEKQAAPEPQPTPTSPTSTSEPSASAPSVSGNVTKVETEVLMRRWDDVLAEVSALRKATWALVKQNATVGSLDGEVLTLLFASEGLASAFKSGTHAQIVAEALSRSLGVTARVTAAVGDLPQAAAAASTAATPRESHRQSSSTGSSDEPAAEEPARPADTEPVPPHDDPPPVADTPQSADEDIPLPPEPDSHDDHNMVPPLPEAAPVVTEPQATPVPPGNRRSSERPVLPPIPSRRSHNGEKTTEANSSTANDKARTRPWQRGNGDDSTGSTDGRNESNATGRAASQRETPSAQSPAEQEAAAEAAWQATDTVELEDSSLVGAPLIAQILGGVVIDEDIEQGD